MFTMTQSEKAKLELEGNIFPSNNCGDFKVLKYNSTTNVEIEFVNTKTKMTVSASNIKKGSIKDPNYPSIYGVGYIGQGEYTSRVKGIQPASYKRWKEMLNRCYNINASEYNSYGGRGVIVAPIWHNYQNYAAWWEANCPNDSFTVDKDVLLKGNKLYSPETCCFVPSDINSVLALRRSERGNYPVGVRLKDGKLIAQINYMGKKIHLGTFATPEAAFEAYKRAKEKCIQEYAEMHKHELQDYVYKALMDYRIDITD